MKQFNIIALCAMSVITLASCELKNELLGNTTEKTEKGQLELGVTVKQPAAQTRAEVSTDNFPVSITGKPGTATADVTVNFESVKDLPLSIPLPVGEYTVTSHTNKEFKMQMDEPYYSGSAGLTITKDITSKTIVTCKMKNSRVQLNYGDDFNAAFSSWTITIDDGNNNTLVLTQDSPTPVRKYWNFADNAVTTIKVNVRAKTLSGNSVSESRTFKKSDVAENYEEVTNYFSGGDALEINMGIATSSVGNVTGITIKTDITFEENGETVEIPTEGEESGEGDTPTESIKIEDIEGNNYLKEGVFVPYGSAADTYPKDVIISMGIPNGIKNLYVKVETNNEDFAFAAGLMGLTTGNGLDLTSDDAEELKNLFTLPKVDDKEYTFSLNDTLLELLATTPGYVGIHNFILTIIDANGNSKSATLKVSITSTEQ